MKTVKIDYTKLPRKRYTILEVLKMAERQGISYGHQVAELYEHEIWEDKRNKVGEGNENWR